MCFSFFLLSDFLPTKSWRFLHCRVFWFLFFNANILEQYYSDSFLGLFEQPVLLLSWHDCDIINTTCQSAKREKNKTKKKKGSRKIHHRSLCVFLVDAEHELSKRYFITPWRSDPSKCDIIILPLLYFYVYYYKNIQSHKGNQIQSLTLVNTKPPHQSNTSGYQLMYVGPHSKHRKKSTNQFSIYAGMECVPLRLFTWTTFSSVPPANHTFHSRWDAREVCSPIQERWPGPTQTALWSCL